MLEVQLCNLHSFSTLAWLLALARVVKDNEFWNNEMFPKLERFYFLCLLPEIVDSRHARGMPIREPAYITIAKTAFETKKKSNTKYWNDNMAAYLKYAEWFSREVQEKSNLWINNQNNDQNWREQFQQS